MAEFLTASFAFPTSIFTTLLGLVVLYWLTVILGFIDVESADSLAGLDQTVPVQIQFAVLFVSGDDGVSLGVITMSQRYACIA